MFRDMRRFKQQVSREACIEILTGSRRGVLAVLGNDGYPYTVPMDYVYEEADPDAVEMQDGEEPASGEAVSFGRIYFHCAKEGHKIDAIRNCDKVPFCVMSEGVQEVLVYDENSKIVAEIFPTEEYLGNVEYFEALKDKVNKGRPIYKQITKVRLREEEFIKNATMKIVRHLNIPSHKEEER